MLDIIELNGRKYRPIKISDTWARSYFEYYNDHYGGWRAVINWNSRERLFNLVTGKIDEE